MIFWYRPSFFLLIFICFVEVINPCSECLLLAGRERQQAPSSSTKDQRMSVRVTMGSERLCELTLQSFSSPSFFLTLFFLPPLSYSPFLFFHLFFLTLVTFLLSLRLFFLFFFLLSLLSFILSNSGHIPPLPMSLLPLFSSLPPPSSSIFLSLRSFSFSSSLSSSFSSSNHIFFSLLPSLSLFLSYPSPSILFLLSFNFPFCLSPLAFVLSLSFYFLLFLILLLFFIFLFLLLLSHFLTRRLTDRQVDRKIDR